MKVSAFFRRNLPGILWTALILLLMGIPGDRFPEIKTFWDWLEPDKLIHIFLFGIWAYLIIRQNIPQYETARKRFLVVVLAAGIVLSATTEILQALVFINRSGNIFDFFANISGMVFGIILYVGLHRKKSAKP